MEKIEIAAQVFAAFASAKGSSGVDLLDKRADAGYREDIRRMADEALIWAEALLKAERRTRESAD